MPNGKQNQWGLNTGPTFRQFSESYGKPKGLLSKPKKTSFGGYSPFSTVNKIEQDESGRNIMPEGSIDNQELPNTISNYTPNIQQRQVRLPLENTDMYDTQSLMPELGVDPQINLNRKRDDSIRYEPDAEDIKYEANKNRGLSTGLGLGAAAMKAHAGYSRSRDKDFSGTESVIQGGLDTGSTGMMNYAQSTGAMSGMQGGAFSLGAAATDAIGTDMSSHGKEEAGGALSGAGKGAAMGAALGSVVPGIGTAVGAVAGGIVGGVSGLIGGSAKRKERLARQKKEREARALRDEQKNRMQLEAEMANEARMYDAQGRRIGLAKQGIKVHSPFIIPKAKHDFFTSKPIEEPKNISKFKRGGKTGVLKDNIIAAGPTHGQKNCTGVKGDKGLAIVANGEKEYEIEKEELILNLKATEQAERICKRYKRDKEDKHLVALGKLMNRELLNNTYDYTKKFKVNGGRPINTKVSEVTTRPKEGTYILVETDIKAEKDKMQVLGKDCEVLTNMHGGERIFSRTHTKKLIELAKKGKTKAHFKVLGRYMYKVVNKQDTQEVQYV